MSAKWTTADIPDQSGRVAVVTGANSGIGYEAASVLAANGAHVVVAVRDLGKGKQAVDEIARGHPGADLAVQELDLSSLASVRAAAAAMRATYPRIDLLINNAGV
ncbi:MAG: SDR family NAD(P)-dependent oxidoreductase, partial [Mycobacterium sp.]